jgi:hypothetical protein
MRRRDWLLVLAMVAWPMSNAIAEPFQDRLVAQVCDQEVRGSDLAPSEMEQQRWREHFGDEAAELLQDYFQREKLRERVLEALLQTFRKEQGVVAKKDDLKKFLEHRLRYLHLRFAELSQESQGIDRRLAAEDLAGLERKTLLERRVLLDKAIPALEGKIREWEDLLASGNEAKFRVNYLAIILSWRTDQALYLHYGGEVCLNGLGMRPLGALKGLIEERRATFGIAILDSRYQDLFDEEWPGFTCLGITVPRRQAEAYFSRPWWESSPIEADQEPADPSIP